MNFKFQFRPYRRRFKPPLQTNHGTWDVRDGIILRLADQAGKFSYGEIAPICWFGSETIQQALQFCRQLPTAITEEMIFSIPSELPACQFGFESAWEALLEQRGRGDKGDKGEGEEALPTPSHTPVHPHILTPSAVSGLLSAGEAALDQWQILWNQGYRTFKWKIGVYPIADELKLFDLLTQALPATSKLRLDANGGISYKQANLWLYTCDRISSNKELPVEIEFIEQPLPLEQFKEMEELSFCYATPIALDESVATLTQMEACYRQGWRGIFTIKPSIAGSPKLLRQFCQAHKIDTVFSSVFETAVGRQAALKLAAELSTNSRAVGFGTDNYFEQDEHWLEQLWKDY